MELAFDEEENTNWVAYCDYACVCPSFCSSGA